MYYYTKRILMKRNLYILFIIAVFMSSCAATARIDKNFSVNPPHITDKTLSLDTMAIDKRGDLSIAISRILSSDEVGRNTFTLFGIPTYRVYSRTGLEKQMMTNVKETLVEAGFDINHDNYPRLEIIINDFYFYNYTFFFPLYFFWGRTSLSVNLKDENDQILWSENVWRGSFLPGFVSFRPVIRRSMRKTLRDLQQACLREDFLEHLSEQ